MLIEPWARTKLSGISRFLDAPCVMDRHLRVAGEDALEELVLPGNHLYDGPVLALDEARPQLITLRPGGFLDHIRAGGALAREWRKGGPMPLRERAERRASGDPLHKGSGRCAALGVSALLVWEGPDGPEFVLGKRSERVVLPGSWHVAPAGMVEALKSPFADSLAQELYEEVALDEGQAERALAGASVLGLSFDLVHLSVGLACMLIVTGRRPVLDVSEHVEVIWRPFTDGGLLQALTELGPERLVPVGAGNLELARWRLQRLCSSS